MMGRNTIVKLTVFMIVVLLFSATVSASTSLSDLFQNSSSRTFSKLTLEITSKVTVNTNGSAIIDIYYRSLNDKFNRSMVKKLGNYYRSMGYKILNISDSPRIVHVVLMKENYSTYKRGVWSITQDENINSYNLLFQIASSENNVFRIPIDVYLSINSKIVLPSSAELLINNFNKTFYLGLNLIKINRVIHNNIININMKIMLHKNTTFDVENILKIANLLGSIKYTLNRNSVINRKIVGNKFNNIYYNKTTYGKIRTSLSTTRLTQNENRREVILRDSNLTLYIAPDGDFKAYTSEGQPITYPGYTSSVNILVDNNTVYGLRGTHSRYLGDYVIKGPVVVSKTSAYITYNMSGIILNVTYTLNGPLIEFNYNIRNTGLTYHSVQVRILIDTQLGPNDGAPLYADGKWWIYEHLIDHQIEKWMAEDSIVHPTLRTNGFIITPTEKIIFAYWPTAIVSDFSYNWSPNRRFYTPGYNISPYSDSCVLQYYNLGTIQPGKSKRIVFYYGTGSLENIMYPELAYTSRLTNLLVDLSKGDAWSYTKASYLAADGLITTAKKEAIDIFKIAFSLFVEKNTDEAIAEYRAFDLRHYPKAYDWLKNFIMWARENPVKANRLLEFIDDSDKFVSSFSILYNAKNTLILDKANNLGGNLMRIYTEECQWRCDQKYVLDKMYDAVLSSAGTNEIDIRLIKREENFEKSFHRGPLPKGNALFDYRYFGTLNTINSMLQLAVSEQRPYDYEFENDPLPHYLYHVLPITGTPIRYNDVYNTYYAIKALYKKIEDREHWDWILFIVGIIFSALILIATGGTVAIFGLTLISFAGLSLSTTTAAILLSIGIVGNAITTVLSEYNEHLKMSDEMSLVSYYSMYTGNFMEYYSRYSCVTVYDQIQKYVYKFIQTYSTYPNRLLDLRGFLELRFRSTYSHNEPVQGIIYYQNDAPFPANVTVILRVLEINNKNIVPISYFVYPESSVLGENLGSKKISHTLDPFEYKEYSISLDLKPGKYIITADMYMNGVLVSQKSVILKKNSWWGDLFSTTKTILTGSIKNGEVFSAKYSPSEKNTQYITFLLEYPGSDIDLHIYDKNGNHVGINYTSGSIDLKIPNSTYYKSHGYELIRVPAKYAPYKIKVIGVDIIGQENFTVKAIEEPKLPGIMAVSPTSINVTINISHSYVYPIIISEVGGQNELHNITISLSKSLKNIIHVSNTYIGNLSSNCLVPIFLNITASNTYRPTTIIGSIKISSAEGTITIPITIHIVGYKKNIKKSMTENTGQLILTLSYLWTKWFFEYQEQFNEIYKNATTMGVDNKTLQEALKLNNTATILILKAWKKEKLKDIRKIIWDTKEILTVPQFWNIRKAWLLEKEAVKLLQNSIKQRGYER